jgi:uncharacterized protein (TIGR01244 family)
VFIRLTESVAVAGEIAPADIAIAAAQGFTTIVNNRPDGEDYGQPTCADMRAAAVAAGVSYTAIPVGHGFTREQVTEMAAVLTAATGPVLAFCRSGTRSSNLWALAEASRGGDADAIIAAAASGGYDVAGLRPTLIALAGE